MYIQQALTNNNKKQHKYKSNEDKQEVSII